MTDAIREIRALLRELDARIAALDTTPAEPRATVWLTYAQAAEYLGVSRSGLYSAVQAGRLKPSGRNGKVVRFTHADLDAFMRGEE